MKFSDACYASGDLQPIYYKRDIMQLSTSSKGLVFSRTVWASILGFVPLVQDVFSSVSEAGLGAVLDVETTSIVASVGALLAIFYRKRAARKIEGVI